MTTPSRKKQSALLIRSSSCASGYQFNDEQTAQRSINASAKTCKCACMTINLGIYSFNLTHVTVAVSVDRAPEVECFAYEDCHDAIL
eukprot:3166904-Pleurochrysis_carterae.AAC.1